MYFKILIYETYKYFNKFIARKVLVPAGILDVLLNRNKFLNWGGFSCDDLKILDMSLSIFVVTVAKKEKLTAIGAIEKSCIPFGKQTAYLQLHGKERSLLFLQLNFVNLSIINLSCFDWSAPLLQ